jgi:hypothetical protein
LVWFYICKQLADVYVWKRELFLKIDTITQEQSELAGIFAADGSMQKEHLCIWGNLNNDREYYDRRLTRLFKQAFDIKIRPHEKLSNSVYGFYVCDKKVLSFFNETLGFPIGKKTYSVKIPSNILHNKDEKIKGAFVRGYFAGDGCLNFDKRYGNYQEIIKIIHTYPRIQITCVSKQMVLDLSRVLHQFGINNFISKRKSSKENEVDSYLLQVSGTERLIRWAEKIGFANRNHQVIYEIFKKYGFVPPNTNYSQRIGILEGRINPWAFYPKWACSLVWIGRQDRNIPLKPSKL